VNRDQKQALVETMSDRLRKADLVVLTDYSGLSVESMNKLRRQLEATGTEVEMRVIKNTLCFRAVEGSALQALEPHMRGPTAVVLGFRDPVAPAKVLSDFSKENDKFKVKAGFFGGKVISNDDIKALASMPSREVLQAQLLGVLQAPISNFLGVLTAVPQQFIGVISAYKEKLEKGE
jgi:large subunit ribosomal protein L10